MNANTPFELSDDRARRIAGETYAAAMDAPRRKLRDACRAMLADAERLEQDGGRLHPDVPAEDMADLARAVGGLTDKDLDRLYREEAADYPLRGGV